MTISAADVVAAVCFVGVLSWLAHYQQAWSPFRNIPGPPSASFLTGNLMQLYGSFAGDFRQQLSERYGRVIKLNGVFGKPMLVLSDPKALWHVLVKNQNTFEEAEVTSEFCRVMFGPGLLSSLGEQHRRQRKMLAPVFSPANMRQITPLVQSLMSQLQNILREKVVNGPQEIDMIDWMGRLAVELIAQACMGHTLGVLEGKNNELGRALKDLMPNFAQVQAAAMLLPFLTRHGSPAVLRWLAQTLPWPALRNMVNIADTLHVQSTDMWEKKKALLAKGCGVNQIGEGKDLMSILVNANNATNDQDRLPDDELLGQITVLLFAGADTTSSALSRILLTLAEHPDIQDKLRQELTEAGTRSGESGYDELMALPYLEAVCRESLRLNPPGDTVQRICRKDTVLHLSFPVDGLDGNVMNEVIVPNGTQVVVNILGVNRDLAIWGPDALEYKPERWMSSSMEKVQVPGVYANTLTFLGGARSCIGMNFAHLEMKVVLSQLLSVFRFAPSEKEIVWKTGSVSSPTVKDSTVNKPYLPMIVSLV